MYTPCKGIAEGVVETMDGHSRVLVKLAPHPVDIVMPTPLARTHVYGGGTGVGADAYAPRLPVPMLESGQLSWAQYEAVQLAGARHAQILPGGERRGFFIGDGTGLGKGREIGGIIIDNRNRGVRRALWLSCSRQLYVDAQRDMLDLFAGDVAVYELGGAATRSLNSRSSDGSLQEQIKKQAPRRGGAGSDGDGVIFATYSLLAQRKTGSSYITKLVNWLGGSGAADDQGVLIFDECHKAKNLVPASECSRPTKTGLAVARLQAELPQAKVVSLKSRQSE